MSVKFDNSKNIWKVSYSKRDPITKQVHNLRRQARTKAEGHRIREELIIRVNEKIRAKKVPTFIAVSDEYFKVRSELVQPSTLYSDRLTLEKHATELGGILVDAITKGQINELLGRSQTLKTEGNKRYFLKILRGLFNYAVERDYIKSNPTPMHKFKPKCKIKSVLNETQSRHFLDKAKELDSEWYPIWATALYTGMRSGELYALKWDCIDFEKCKIKVCLSWNNKNGFKATKSGDDRIIDLPPGLMPLFRDLYATRINDFVLPRLQKWDKGEQARELRAFLIGIGLPPMRFHDLRGSWATILLTHGLPPAKVMAMGGWKDIKTMLIYMNKAGIDVAGALDWLKLHDHSQTQASVISFNRTL
jgi:integrase